MKIVYPKKLYHQIAALVLVIIVSVFITFGWFTAGSQTELMRKVIIESSTNLTRGLSDSCAHYLLISAYSGLDQLLERFIHMSGARGVQVYRADGKLLSESSITPSVFQSLNSLLENIGKISGSEKANITIRDDIMIVSNPVISVKVIGWVHIIFSLKNINEMRRNIWSGTAFATLFGIVLNILILMFFFRRLTDAIQRLSDFARHLGDSKGAKVDVQHSSLEVTQLCSSLNYASVDLFEKEQELKTYRDNLENLVKTRTTELEKEIVERKKSEKNYKTLFREMLDGFALHEIICDESGHPIDYRFLAVNPAFERMTGLKAVDIIGRTVLDRMPDTEMRWIETYGKVALTGEPVHLENYSTTLQKHFEVTAYRQAPGQFACFVADITEKKHAAEEKQRLQIQLQQAQKLEAIGTLAGGIAHDFNNILGAIVGYSEIIREDLPPDSPNSHDINQILTASHRAKDLVKQILAFSSQVQDQKIPMQPAVIVKEAIALLRSSIPTTISIKQDIDAEAGMILADPTQIHQVVMNLATNAFHAMEAKGGTLTISVEKKILSQDDLAILPDLQPGTFVQLSIRDTGEGILPEIRERIFDPFFTTKEVGKGTGLGLSMVYSIVKGCNGSITCDSRMGEGTEFRILLPALEGHAIEENESTALIPHGKEHILLIDDEEILVELGQTMLKRLGYHVTTRGNSLDALTTFQNQPDAFDLIITDQTMPGMTGVDLARRILQIRPQMPIILCTGYSSLVSEDQAKAAGIKGFAYKPLARKEIGELIRTVLDGRQF